MRYLRLTALGLASATALSAQAPPTPDTWAGTLGGLGLIVPRYAGSSEHRLLPVPMVEARFRNRVVLGPSLNGLGIVSLTGYAVRTRRLDVAVVATGLPDRPASRADALAGTSDRDFAASFGLSVSLRMGPFEATAGGTQGVNAGAGAQGLARLGYSRRIGPVFATAAASAAFADAKQMRREFGVTDAEAALRLALYQSGDPRLEARDLGAYSPPGGLRHVAASLGVFYPFATRWFLLGFGEAQRLSGEAAASPLVRRRLQVSGGAGIGWQL